MARYTLTYSNGVEGWPSFYSFEPDYMVGMNQQFYSFKRGSLWVHNSDDAFRNTFYGQNNTSSISGVFNQSPLETKLFKTISLQSDKPWGVTLNTNIEPGGSIDAGWFDKKEGVWFSFIRSAGSNPAVEGQFEMRYLTGVGISESVVDAGTNNPIVNFPTSLQFGSIISVGDYVYFSRSSDSPAYSEPNYCGVISAINVDLSNNINQIVLDSSGGGTEFINVNDGFFFTTKNSVAESSGVLGQYCEFTASIISPTATELFAVEAEVMKSNP
jgi:hypothetical protein